MIFRPDLLAPEFFLLGVILALFFQSLGDKPEPRAGTWMPYAALVTGLAAMASLGMEGTQFHGAYRIDALSQFFKLAVSVGLLIATHLTSRNPELSPRQETDYQLMLALSAWGLMLLASSVELVTMMVALEISSFSLYALVPLRAERREAAEAGVKYALFGAAATGLSLYGLAWVWMTRHTTQLDALMAGRAELAASPLAILGLTLFLAAFLYKLALFPFHFWAPDVYQGAGNETAAVVATLPKLGAVVVLARLAALAPAGGPEADVLAALAAASMTLGNLMALAQRDVKRILGFSSTAHAGYVVIGLVSGTAAGLAAASFYALVYLLMNLACFWVLCRYSGDGRNLTLDDLSGMYARAPMLAFTLAVGAFGLVGLPPTAGFTGKLFLLTAAWGRGYDWLVIVAAVNTAISVFYYLNLVRYAYTGEPAGALPTPVPGLGPKVVGAVLAFALLLLGMAPSPIYEFAAAAGRALMP